MLLKLAIYFGVLSIAILNLSILMEKILIALFIVLMAFLKKMVRNLPFFKSVNQLNIIA
nr:MAG TPA: hypothetical protein [Caudoviricetes sp.]